MLSATGVEGVLQVAVGADRALTAVREGPGARANRPSISGGQ